MKKQEIIAQANKAHNPIWDLVSILENNGKIEKTSKIRKPAVAISENQILVNLSELEILIITRENLTGPITNYRLLEYDLMTDTVSGGFK